MLIYVKLLLQELSRLSEVLYLQVSNKTAASRSLSLLFSVALHMPEFFLGTADWDDDLSPHVPALPAFKWGHILPLSLDTWRPGTQTHHLQVLIPEDILQEHSWACHTCRGRRLVVLGY